jgi:hypothetical protein
MLKRTSRRVVIHGGSAIEILLQLRHPHRWLEQAGDEPQRRGAKELFGWAGIDLGFARCDGRFGPFAKPGCRLPWVVT